MLVVGARVQPLDRGSAVGPVDRGRSCRVLVALRIPLVCGVALDRFRAAWRLGLGSVPLALVFDSSALCAVLAGWSPIRFGSLRRPEVAGLASTLRSSAALVGVRFTRRPCSAPDSLDRDQRVRFGFPAELGARTSFT